ncbi:MULTISPECIES: ABC transporter permease [Clavibacter]|uniref:Iron ABC transporter permease n=2 Tax=Clavibacter TaxID=1573 RepID=A0A399NY84_9MICO|nr:MULTISPECIES: iron ABC transporter permease [Clavibacter]KDP90485.1 iron ABC transporter permease [Clavibacter cf. michiganensis LMG 26808]RII98708.1 iron ABC transporter permease [Clavibacter michiganensis]UKF26404.1 iron ABC transporter permease [Clavibacter sp. A6099]
MRTPVRALLRSPLGVVVLIAALWFIVTFLVFPNANLLVTTFFPDGAFSGRALEKLVSSDRAMRSVGNSLLLAVTLAITVNVVGIFIVLVTEYFVVRGSRVLWLGYATTLIYGGIVLAAGYNFIYGRYGFVTAIAQRVLPDLDPDWFSGYFAVVIVMTFATTTNHMLFLRSSLAAIDHQTIEAARSMGAGTGRILFRIVLPALRPMIFAVTVLTFLTGLGALTAPLVLGGTGFQTVAPMIVTFSKSTSSRDLAALLAIVLGVATIVLLAIMNRVEKSGVYFSVAKVATPLQKQRIRNPIVNGVVHVVAYALFVVYALPVILIVLFSFLDSKSVQTGTITLDSFTLRNYATVLGSPDVLRPFVVSLVYSALAAVIVVAGLLFVARMIQRNRNWVTATLEYLLHIPWILPTILIALALLQTFDRPQPLIGGQVLTGTTWLLLVAYVVVKVPFTLRLLKAAFASVPQSLEDAARILGAKSLTTFRRVLVPLVIPTVAAITALNFNSLLDDYDAAVFLYQPLYEPLGIAIKASTEGEANLDSMSITFVYTVLLMIIMGLTMYLVYGRTGGRTRRRGRTGTPAVETTAPALATSDPGAPAPTAPRTPVG